jgi:hypothetical protein
MRRYVLVVFDRYCGLRSDFGAIHTARKPPSVSKSI